MSLSRPVRRWLLAFGCALCSIRVLADPGIEAELARTTIDQPVEVAARELPVGPFLIYLASLARLEVHIPAPLPGLVSGRFDAPVLTIVEQLSNEHGFVWWRHGPVLHVDLPAAMNTVERAWPVTGASGLAAEMTLALAANAHNTIVATPGGLRIRGLTVFVQAADAYLGTLEPVDEPVESDVRSLEPDAQPSLLDGLDEIPGYNTF